MKLTLALTIGLMLLAGAAAAQRTDIVIGMQLEPPVLDPTAGAAAAIDEVVYANVFEGLTRFGPDGSVLPALAESWEVAPDGLSWVFHLREGVTFHDGTPFTAEDVAFSFDRAMAEGSLNAQKGLFAGINEVTAIDDVTVEIGLDAPKGSLLANLAWGDAVIVSPATADGNATNPVGTGPFAFSNWVQGDRIDLARRDDYWGEMPALEAVTFKFISDPTAAFAAMMAGDIDAFPNYPAPENLAQFATDPRFQVLLGSTEGETILAMNNARVPFTRHRGVPRIDPRTAQADRTDPARPSAGAPDGSQDRAGAHRPGARALRQRRLRSGLRRSPDEAPAAARTGDHPRPATARRHDPGEQPSAGRLRGRRHHLPIRAARRGGVKARSSVRPQHLQVPPVAARRFSAARRLQLAPPGPAAPPEGRGGTRRDGALRGPRSQPLPGPARTRPADSRRLAVPPAG